MTKKDFDVQFEDKNKFSVDYHGYRTGTSTGTGTGTGGPGPAGPQGPRGNPGADGQDGAQGPQGSYMVQIYLRSANTPDTPVVTWSPGNALTNNSVGWSLTIPAGTDSLWESEATFDPANDTNITSGDWSVPFQAGSQGPAGVQGPAGAQGPQGLYQVNLYRMVAAKPDSPTDVTWTNGVLSGANASGWSLTRPTGSDRTWRVSASHDPASPTTPITTWGRVQLADVPTTASEVPSVPSGSLAANNVQAALDELQAEITALPSTPTGLTTEQERKLSSITAVSSTTYDTLISQIRFTHNLTTDKVFTTNAVQTFTAPSQAVSIAAVRLWSVPEELDLSHLEWRVRRNDGRIRHTQAIVDFQSTEGLQAYDYTATLNPTIVLQAGTTLYLARRDTIPETFTLSDKYRVPAEVVTDLAENALTGTNARKLADVTEGTTVTYADLPGGLVDHREGTETPTLTSPFIPTSTRLARMYFEVPTGTSLARLSIRQYNPSGTLVNSLDNFRGLAKQTRFNTGKDRYLTNAEMSIIAGNSIRIQASTTTSDTFTLSEKYRIPASGVVNLPVPEKGARGEQGAQGAYIVRIYTRSVSTPAPTNVVWVPASGGNAARLTNTGSPVTWSLTVPGDGLGDVWEATATFDPAASATEISTWSPSFQAGSTGPAGPQGSQGEQGVYTVRLYRRSANDVLRPTNLTWTASTGVLSGTGAAGWSTTIPQGAGEPVWETNAEFDPSGSATTITAWGLPFRLTGPKGDAGDAGADGDTGFPAPPSYQLVPESSGGGAAGAQQVTPTRPTQLTWTASTGALSGTDASTWSLAVPSGDGTLWAVNPVFNRATPAGTVTTWSEPFRLTGTDGATGPKGADAMLSASQTSKLGGITEVSATTYDTMIGSIGFSPQFTINRFYSARQQPSYTNGSTSSTFRMAAARLWDVPMETDLGLLEWRVRRADGEVVSRQPFGTFQNTRRLHMYDYEGDVNPSIPVAPGQTLFIARRDNIPTTFTLSQEYRVPAQVVTDLVDNALAPTNFRKLGDVTEGTTVSYTNLTGGTLAFNPSSGTPTFTSTLTSTSTGGPAGRVLFEVPTDTSLANLSIREYAADGTLVNECPLEGLTKQTSFSSGKDRYLTVVTLTLATGVTARLQTSTTTSDTFTLSEKYRVPSVDVMRTPTALTSTTLEGALEELRTNIDNIPSGGGSGGSGGSLSGTDARKLGDITEVATRSYADTTGGTVAPSSGANPPVPVGSFAASYVATSALTDNFFFEVTAGQSISSAVLRVFNSSNVAVGSPIRVSGATAQTDSSNGKDRYLTTQDITVPAGGRVRIQTETVTPTTFTLSSKYRIPASGVTGLPSSSQGSQGRYRVNLYRATSDTNVTAPVVTWTASSGALSGTDATSWSTTQPSGTLPVWRTSAEFDPSGSDTTITTWATPFRLTGPQGAQGATGNPGAAGAQGAQGSYTVRIYTRSQSTPAPSGVTWVPASGANAARLTNTGSPTTWSLTVPSNPTIGALWEATATFDPSSSATGINAWSGAFQAGSTGPAGPQGTQGEQGSYTVRLYQRSTSTTVAMPSNLTWTASTGALSGTQASSWSTTIPAGTDPVWETNAVFNPSGSATTITSWGIPFRLTGPAGTGSGTSLSASNGRKLSEITEADGFSYTQVPGSELGGNTSQFSPAIMGITSSFSINIFVQVPDTLTITDDIRFRHISGTGTVKTDVALSSLTLQTGAPAGRVRYRTAAQVALTPGDTIRIFSRTTGRTYTLSSKYRIPAGSIVGTTSGAKGDQGAQGSYLVRLYKRSSTAITATPADVTWTSPGTLGGANAASWALTIPAGTDPLYSVTANFNPASPATISIWSSVFSVGGIAGTDGDDGAAGAQGRYTVRVYQRNTNDVLRPTLLTWTAATGSLSGSHAVDWETTIPTGQDPLWETNAVFDPASGATTITAWSLPIRLTGLKGDKGDTGPAGTGGALSASNTRKLAEITEATRADTFANEPLSGISVAANVGGTLTPRDTGTSWSPTFTGGTGASGERLFFEIDDGATLTDLFMRVFNQDGSLNMSLSVSDAVSQSNPNTGKLRYLASQTFNNPTNGIIRLQRRSAGTLGYTLSDNYIVPADIVSGLAAGKVTNTATGNLTATTVQGALNELQTEIDDLPSPEESETFFDHVELTGTLSNLSISADFYYLPLGDLPERDLSKWTHVTNSQFPQPTLTAYTEYVVLLNNAKYPNMITWNPATSQPVDSATNATPANITYGGFDQVDGLHVPEGYEGFEFLMPSWNAASTLLTGARLQVGDLTRGNVSRVDLSSAIKVTDDNLDISNPTTSLTEIQREKLQGLQLKTYTQPAVTEGKPSANYKLVAASAWPDPAIDYSTFDPRTNATLGQDPSSTGIRENQGGRTGLASFFNLITDTEATFNQPNPTTRGYNTLYNQQYSRATEYADCAGVWGGTISAVDNTSDSSFRVDDGRGLFSTMTLHLPPDLSNGSYPIMNIGNSDEDGNHALVLRKNIDDTYPPGNSLAVRRFSGPPTSTTSNQYVTETLGAPNGATRQIFRADGGLTGGATEDISHDWIFPASLTASSAAPARVNMHVRVWDNGSDEGEHDFTSSLPASIQNITNLGADNPAGINNPGGTDFVLSFIGAGFPRRGPQTVTCNVRYTASDSSVGNQRAMEITFNDLSDAGIYYEVRIEVSTQQSVTTPAGTFREDVIIGGVPDGASEIGFYAYATGAAGSRRMNYRAAINGRSGDLEIDDFSGNNARVPLGRVPVTFGHASSPPTIAVNRFAIFKPTGVLSVDDMNHLTAPAQRNRPDVGGLVRHGGKTFHEVFSPAYKSTIFTSGVEQNLAHPVSGTDRTSANRALGVNLTWTNANLPPEIQIGSGLDELNALTDFTASLTADIGVLFDDSALHTPGSGRTISPSAFLLLRATLQEKLAGGAWTPVPGPELAVELRAQTFDDGAERPAGLEIGGDALLRRSFSTVGQFKTGASYRIRVTGYRLSGAGNQTWPTAASVVKVAANQSFLMMDISPAV